MHVSTTPIVMCLTGDQMEYDIRAYGGSKRGRSHESTGKPCQDSNHFGLHPNHPNIAILIVADGVGSAERSDDGSRIAVDTVKRYLEGVEPPFTPDVIREAYEKAWSAIDQHTAEGTGWPCDYDTTLSTAVFDAESGNLIYGHSGDGAILAIGLNGVVESITIPQKGAEANSVKPLRDLSAWEFGRRDGPFVSVMAMTDGVLDLLMPGRLKLTDEPIYIRLVSWLADFKFFEKKGTPIEDCFAKRLSYLYSDIHKGITNDDLTFIAAMNIHVTSEYRGDEYYKEPDWAALNEEWKRKAYPSLYKDDGTSKEDPVEGPIEEIKEGPIEQPDENPVTEIVREAISKGSEALERAKAMLRMGMRSLAALQFRAAAEEGDQEAKEYLDTSTLGSLDDREQMDRCLIAIALNDAAACLLMAEYWSSKGESDKADVFLRKARLLDQTIEGLKTYSNRLDSMSIADRPR